MIFLIFVTHVTLWIWIPVQLDGQIVHVIVRFRLCSVSRESDTRSIMGICRRCETVPVIKLFYILGISWHCLRQVFSPPATLFTDVIDFTVALYWTLDIVGTFFTAYYSPKGEMVRSHRQIAWHYVMLG